MKKRRTCLVALAAVCVLVLLFCVVGGFVPQDSAAPALMPDKKGAMQEEAAANPGKECPNQPAAAPLASDVSSTPPTQSEPSVKDEPPSRETTRNAGGEQASSNEGGHGQGQTAGGALDAKDPNAAALLERMDVQIPQAESFSIPKGVEYKPEEVLVSVAKGTDAAGVSGLLEKNAIHTVDPNSVEPVVDGLVRVFTTGGASVEEAVNELRASGCVYGAQPNYIYRLTDDEILTDDAPAPLAETKKDANSVSVGEDSSAHAPASATTEPGEPTEPMVGPQPDGQDPNTAEPESLLNAIAKQDALILLRNYQWGLISIEAPEAWQASALANKYHAVGVAVLDEGFQTNHPDLRDNIVATYNACEPGNDVRPPDEEDGSHGSHVAGVIAARASTGEDDQTIDGITNNTAQLVLVRVMDDEQIAYSDVLIQAYDYILKNKDAYNIRVVNMSLGGYDDGDELTALNDDTGFLNCIDTAYEQGIVTVASAGNIPVEADDDLWVYTPFTNWPSDYGTVVSVMDLRNKHFAVNGVKALTTAQAQDVERSSSSNYNRPNEKTKDISAPGTDILSALYEKNGEESYGYKSGTSMAAPHVAGIVALEYAANPSLTPSMAISALYSSARDLGAPGWDVEYGFGEANAKNAVQAISEGTITGPAYLAVGGTGTYALASTSASLSSSSWTFASSNTEVLEVNATSGQATGKASGKVMLAATSGTYTAFCEVTVVGPIAGSDFLTVGGSASLKVTSPSALAWEWHSSNADVATVTNDGVVCGKAAGTATITATLVADPNVTFTKDVRVYDYVGGIRYAAAGSSFTLSSDEAGQQKPEAGAQANNQGTWTSSDETVATVSDGTVTCVKAGVATIRWESSDNVAMAWLVCVCGPLEGPSTVVANNTIDLSVAGWVDFPEAVTQGKTWVWSSSDQTRAVVSESGAVTGKAATEADAPLTITATLGSGDDVLTLQTTIAVIPQKSLADDDVFVTIPNQTFSGGALTPEPVVTLGTGDGAITLAKGTDYTIATAEAQIVNPGDYTVTIEGTGSNAGGTYIDSKTATFTVDPKEVSVPTAASVTYNGKSQCGVASANYYQLVTSASGVATTAKDVGEYTTTVTLKTGYAWSGQTDPEARLAPKSLTWSINKATLNATYSCTINVGGTPSTTATVTGFVSGENASNAAGYKAPTVRINPNWRNTAGTYSVTPTGGSSKNYKFTYVAGKLVVRPVVTSVSLSKASLSLKPGDTHRLFATVLPANAVNRSLTWSSSNASVASVSSDGVVTARSVGTATIKATAGGKSATCVVTVSIPAAHVAYRTHVQKVGWQDWRRDGVMAGTSGRALRLEGINIKLEGAAYSGSIEYRTHVQTYGWQSYRKDGAMSGTSGEAKRLEAIQIRLTGQMAQRYDVWYRVHAQTYGWLGWAKNDSPAGTAGLAKRLEGIEIRVLPKGSAAPGQAFGAFVSSTGASPAQSYSGHQVSYRTHVQSFGWQTEVADGQMSGTQGLAKRLEGIELRLRDKPVAGGIEYRTHVQTYGWQSYRKDGAMSGTSGQAKRLEAIQIRLTGQMAARYDVWYRVHAQTFGWMGWAKNDQQSRTAGYAKRLEGIQVLVLPKGSPAPGPTANAFRQRS